MQVSDDDDEEMADASEKKDEEEGKVRGGWVWFEMRGPCNGGPH
jgi:hypothetical protein